MQHEHTEDREDAAASTSEQPTPDELAAPVEDADGREAEADSDLDFDLGGDGTDLHQPVRAHVDAALVPTDTPYPPPLDELLRLGETSLQGQPHERIATLGLTQEHVPDLVRMARDRALNTASGDSDEVWAPIHALHALKHLDVTPFVPELIPLFDVDIDWLDPELADVLENTGPIGLEHLAEYIRDETRWFYGRTAAAATIVRIAKRQPELRERAIKVISNELADAGANDPTFNGFLLAELLNLQPVEALPAIRHAFEHDAVDETIAGDWSAVLEALGQTPDPADPLVARSRERWNAARVAVFPDFSPEPARAPGERAPSPGRKKSSKATQKTKRKMSDASRKANRKKKKRK